MSILPSYLYESTLREAADTSTVLPTPREYGIDFTTGKLTGRIVEGLEAIKVWVWNCLHTERYKHAIYSWQYGVEYEQYIGETVTDEYLQNDCQTETEDALLVNPYITGIDDFEATLDGARMHIAFKLNTSFGSTEVSEYV